MSIEQQIWDFLPARRMRARTTVPVVIAANLGLPVVEVVGALMRMRQGGHVVLDQRGSWHRGLPL